MSGKGYRAAQNRRVNREMLRESAGWYPPPTKTFAAAAAVAGTGRRSKKAKRSKKRAGNRSRG